jgi:aspartate carbamoyltransferase regulatory subunit
MTYTARSKTLHKNLLGKQEKGYVIDHINRNKCDNRLENLRVITAKENSYNRTKNANSNNKYKGVVKRGNKYVASISKDGIKKVGGYYRHADNFTLIITPKAGHMVPVA